MKSQKPIKICLAASAGGHMGELLSLACSWEAYDRFYMTTTEILREKLHNLGKVYVVGECNREHPFRAIQVLVRCIKIALREKPDVIISTGAAPACLLCLVGKLLGAKVVWVDSIANIERLSLSGRIIRPFADLILTQWPELADKYPNVEYAGSVI